MQTIPFSEPLEAKVYEGDGSRAFLFTHGERTDIEDEVFKYMAKDLQKKGVTVVAFRFPFRVRGKRIPDDHRILDDAFLAAWNWVKEQPQLSEKKWAIGGHGIGASTAMRVSGLFGEIPPVVAISYPMFPANKPEYLDVSELYAVMGPIFFITGDSGNRGTHERLLTQINMMATFAETKQIKGADHNMNVKGRPAGKIAAWMANDINKFLLTVL